MATLMYMTVTYQHVEKEGGVVGHHHHHFLEEVEGQLRMDKRYLNLQRKGEFGLFIYTTHIYIHQTIIVVYCLKSIGQS